MDSEAGLGVVIVAIMLMVGFYAGRGKQETKNVVAAGALVLLLSLAVFIAGAVVDLLFELSPAGNSAMTLVAELAGSVVGLLWLPAFVVALARGIGRAWRWFRNPAETEVDTEPDTG